jgi:type IV fimbrial biogenesis protein FimT
MSMNFIIAHGSGTFSKRMTNSAGLSAIELLTVLGILSILMALAVPGFQALIERWRVQQAVEAMKSTLYYARSEAVKRGGRIRIQKIANNTNGCSLATTTQKWSCGWFVFHDSNGNKKLNAGEEVLQSYSTPAKVNVINHDGGEGINVDRYGKMDGLNAKGFSFSPAPTGISSPATRGICMASGGRIRVIEDVPCT